MSAQPSKPQRRCPLHGIEIEINSICADCLRADRGEFVPEVMFTHEDDNGKLTTYAVGRIILMLSQLHHLAVNIQIDPVFADYAVTHRGVEQHRLDRLADVAADDMDPVIFALQDDGSGLLIDGTHRYITLHRRGDKTIKGFLLPKEIWWHFVGRVEGLTMDDIQKRPSGI